MSHPTQEIENFLSTSGTRPDASVEVALQFAQSMCHELRAALSEWEDAEATLQQIRADAAAGN